MNQGMVKAIKNIVTKAMNHPAKDDVVLFLILIVNMVLYYLKLKRILFLCYVGIGL